VVEEKCPVSTTTFKETAKQQVMTVNSDTTRVAAIYNPQNQSKQQLIEGFVVRQQIFQKLFKAIKEATMDVPEQHFLLLGRRGMGKTTLLLRLAYEIENDPALNSWLIPVVFNEEEYGIRRLFNFWERIMEELEAGNPAFRFSGTERQRLSAQHRDDDAYERALFDILSAELERTGQKIIVFIDNFGDMASRMKDEEAHRLRKILQTSADIRIIAASALVMESFYSYQHPFYEFFKVQELKGLDARETRELLLKLSDHYKKEAVARIVEQHPGRVEALRRITGGVIRTMVLLFEIFADDDDGSAFKDLEIILDRATPLYKHRMDDLSNQQQAIVEVIALHWDAISVKEITERTRLESKTVSAQLQLLEKNGIIEKRPTKTKNHL
jgi:DNA polymerase III delta prime subunit